MVVHYFFVLKYCVVKWKIFGSSVRTLSDRIKSLITSTKKNNVLKSIWNTFIDYQWTSKINNKSTLLLNILDLLCFELKFYLKQLFRKL